MRRVWKTNLSRMRPDESGYVLIMSLFILLIVSLIGIALAIIGIQEFNLSARTKLMDQAYTIAEAGINRAGVQVREDRSLTISAPTGNNVYGEAGDTPQWEIAMPGESFGDGAFTVQIWQSDVEPTNPAMKVIVATGMISSANRTAERTIETRVVCSAGGDYDASFDYCIYNGLEDSPDDPWPDVDFLAGNFVIDGCTPYPDPNDPSTPAGTTPHKPKGAVYTRGTIDFPTQFAAGVEILGNLIAEDDIYLSNVYGVDAVGSGILINGWDKENTPGDITDDTQAQVVAGLDGTGSVYIETVSGVLNEQTMKIHGYVCAADNVEIDSDMNITLSSPIAMEGIVAGGDLLVNSSGGQIWGAEGGIELGNVFTAGKVEIVAAADGGTRFNQVNSGRDATGMGVYLETSHGGAIGRDSSPCGQVFTQGKLFAETNHNDSSIKVGRVYAGTDTGMPSNYYGGIGVDATANLADISLGNIFSRGRVNFTITDNAWAIGCGSIRAGTDSSTGSGGVGININAIGASIDANGTLTAQGSIYMDALSFGGAVGDIWSGTNIDIELTGLLGYNAGALEAVGDIAYDTTNLLSLANTNGRAKANGNVNLELRGLVGYQTIKGVEAGGNIGINNHFLASYVKISDLSGEDAGSWSGADPSNDCIWCGGDVDFSSTLLSNLRLLEDVEAYGTISDSGWVSYSGASNDGNTNLRGWTPGVTLPGLPEMAPWYDYETGSYVQPTGGPEDADNTPLHETPPVVDQSTLLNIAGLDNQTVLVEPNWFYFEVCATQDHVANPAVPHVLRDREASEPVGAGGDYGDADDGMVVFQWDATMPYSSQETVFCGDTWINGSGDEVYVDVYIDKLDWDAISAVFEGTIVCKGNVYIDCADSDWVVATDDTLNIVAGGDIEVVNSSTTLVKQDNAHYHFWAVDDITFNNSGFALAGNSTFYGSFTAGNRVVYSSSTLWENTTFKWSRWALDPVAWLPPFKIYTWKEI